MTSITSESVQRYYRLTGQLQHQLRGFDESEKTVVVYANLGNMGDGDVMSLSFIVIMQAAKSAREDLKAIMDSAKARGPRTRTRASFRLRFRSDISTRSFPVYEANRC